MSSTNHVHTTTWHYFAKNLAGRFINSPNVVMDEIMTNIYDLVQEFSTSSNGAVGASLIAMHRLFEILLGCFYHLKVCLILFQFCDPST